MLKQIIKHHRNYFKFWYKWNYHLIGIGTKYIENLEGDAVDTRLKDYVIIQQHKGLLLYALIKSIYYTWKFCKIQINNEKHLPGGFSKGLDVETLNSYDYHTKVITVSGSFSLDKIPDFMKNTKFTFNNKLKVTDFSMNMLFPLGENIYITKNNYYPRFVFELFNTEDYVMRDMVKELVSVDIANFENQILQIDAKGDVEKIQ